MQENWCHDNLANVPIIPNIIITKLSFQIFSRLYNKMARETWHEAITIEHELILYAETSTANL